VVGFELIISLDNPTVKRVESDNRRRVLWNGQEVDEMFRRLAEFYSPWSGEGDLIDRAVDRISLFGEFVESLFVTLSGVMDTSSYDAAQSVAKGLVGEAAALKKLGSDGGGLKVPTTGDHPVTTGSKMGRGITPAVVAVKTRNVYVQAECRILRRDAAVGGDPRVRADRSTQTLHVSRDLPATSKVRGTQVEGCGPTCASGGDLPACFADGGLSASRDPRGSPTPSERRRRRRRKQRAARRAGDAPSNSSAKVEGTSKGDMTLTGTPVGVGRTQGKKRGYGLRPSPAPLRAPCPLPWSRRRRVGPVRHLVWRPPAVPAGPAWMGRGPRRGGVLRSGLSSPPPPPRPEPKRKKELLRPPSKAAAASGRYGMRIRGASIPANVIADTRRDVTVENVFSAVSLLRECGLGSLVLGPASHPLGGEGIKAWSQRREE